LPLKIKSNQVAGPTEADTPDQFPKQIDKQPEVKDNRIKAIIAINLFSLGSVG